jgi:hypothetical protein
MIKKIFIYSAIILAAIVLSGGGVYYWEQGAIKDVSDNCLSASQNAVRQSNDNSLELQQELTAAQKNIGDLEVQKNSLESENQDLSSTLAKYNEALAKVSVSEGVKVGDKFGDFTVSSVGPLTTGMKMDFGKNIINLKIGFSGQATLTGDYYFIPDGGDVVGDTVCFDQLDLASELKMPRLKGVEDTDFCFGNEALTMLGKKSGKATVLIKNFTLNYYPAGGITPTAELVKVLSKE